MIAHVARPHAIRELTLTLERMRRGGARIVSGFCLFLKMRVDGAKINERI